MNAALRPAMAGLVSLIVAVGAAGMATSASAAAAQGASDELLRLVPEAAQKVCSGGAKTAPVSSAKLLHSDSFEARGGQGEVYEWRLPSDQLMRVTEFTGQDKPGPLYFLDVYANGGEGQRRALLRGVVAGNCKFMGGQDVLYSPDDPGRPYALQRLGPDMSPVNKPRLLNPAVPAAGGDPSCLRVAVLDNGVNYLLPEIAPHLARYADGRLVGHDYWEGDDRPFDYGYPSRSLDPRISAFSPRQHGTGVASVFLQNAPASACVAPYRYSPAGEADGNSDPRQMIDDMAAAGIRIVNLSSGRDKPWPEFRAAMQAHPEILFVLAAGNGGRDIGERPTYPPAYRLDNVIVVAATNQDGTLWKQSNYGDPVDVAIMAVNLSGTVGDGSVKELTGTSLAAPRVTGLAARLIAASPNASASAIKQQILAHAKASGEQADGIPVLTEKELKIP